MYVAPFEIFAPRVHIHPGNAIFLSVTGNEIYYTKALMLPERKIA
jgi:hypothetical protein